MSSLSYHIFPLGDAALTIDFGNVINDTVNEQVLYLFHQVKALSHPAIADVVPAYSSLTIHYRIAALHSKSGTAYSKMTEIVSDILSKDEKAIYQHAKRIEVPVCYATQFGLDIAALAKRRNITVEEVIRLHTSKTYLVHMVGFLPGFPYMGEVDERIVSGRKKQPRTNVPAGSVGIAGKQTGIYPLTSPGGWQIIGRTPLKIFDKDSNNPVLFEAGDEVKFYSITEDEFADYQSRHS